MVKLTNQAHFCCVLPSGFKAPNCGYFSEILTLTTIRTTVIIVCVYSRSHNDAVLNVLVENFMSEIAAVFNRSCMTIEENTVTSKHPKKTYTHVQVSLYTVSPLQSKGYTIFCKNISEVTFKDRVVNFWPISGLQWLIPPLASIGTWWQSTRGGAKNTFLRNICRGTLRSK